jgi:hypothetical protein
MVGENYVPAYQMSATPWVTSSQVTQGGINTLTFSNVTRFVKVKNNSASSSVLAVGFTQNGFLPANSNFFVLSGTQEFNAEIKTDRLFISGVAGTSNYSVLAGLTIVLPRDFQLITGSANFSAVG